MVQVFGTGSEFAGFMESNRRPRVTPPFSSKQVAGQGLALMPLGVTVRRRFTDVPTRALESRDNAARDGVAPGRKDYRNRPRLPLEGNGRRSPVCQDDVGLQADNSCARARIRCRSIFRGG